MHNISSLFREEVEKGGRVFKLKTRIDFKDGSSMELDGKDFLTKGISLKDDTANGNSFGCGNIIAKQIDLSLNNYTGKFSDKDFEGAVIWPRIGLLVKQSYQGERVEYINLGPFTADSADVRANVLSVTAYDYAEKLDKPYSQSKLTYPAKLKDIVYQACLDCGIVPLNQNDFNNSDYRVEAAPDGESTTYRDVVSAALQLAGYNGRFDENGKFFLHWYDLGETAWTFNHISDYAVSDTVITGVQISSEVETPQDDGSTKKEKKDFIYGTDEYAIKLSSNILISGDPTDVLNKLGPKLVGMRFRTFSSTRLFNPALEAGDCIKLVDRMGNEYTSVITSMSYSIGSTEKFVCGAQTKSTNSKTRFSDAAKAESAAKKQARNEIDYYDTYAKQFSAMASAVSGYFTTTETLEDGSTILYAHDKPELDESTVIWKKTGLVVAVSNNGLDGPWRGLDKDGNAILNDIAAKTILADKIVSGRMQTQDGEHYLDLDTGECTATRLIGSAKWFDDYPENKIEAVIGTDDSEILNDMGLIIKLNGKSLASINVPHDGWTAPSISLKHEDGIKGSVWVGFDGGVHISSRPEDPVNDSIIYLEATTTEINDNLYVNDIYPIMSGMHVNIHGDLTVDGQKSRAVRTSIGRVSLSAYETAEPYFGDIGESKVGYDGTVCIPIEPLFSETVNTDYVYQVFLQPYCDGNFFVKERLKDRFIVSGPANGKFAYEIKVRQRDYEKDRLEILEG